MKDGLYHVHFKSNQQDFGAGVVTVRQGKVNGGDFGYFYQGDISEDAALLKVTRFNDQVTSVFGPVKEFMLDLKVKPVMGYHILDGHIQGRPDMQIQIHTRLLSDLV
ncbi:GrlR family regulatory protein [Pantoea sp. At-9b]|uniref:GrlR family regulatory protein n=1 Tax=Pantoea sp. (strain At-9b) TaxID=592316 RepID=UPI0001B401D0|nr:GrlR family regulatory protein [Pantoea sp. At-9b]ADU68732.1 hypothetical protein Pat9b_1414 [Pantoea sp. At-9b]